MNAEHQIGEDLETQVLAGRPVSQAGPWRILVGNSDLAFSPVLVTDPILTGAQILSAAEIKEPAEHLVFQMLASGLLEEINPEETTDIRIGRVARFLVFRNDRAFRLLVDDRALDWGASHISGATLRTLAGRDEPGLAVWQDMRGQTDLIVLDEDLVDLSIPGVERFYLRACSVDILVNGEQKTVSAPRLRYWEVVKLGFPDANPEANIVYTIDYAFGPRQNPEGSLGEHQSVRLKDGMKFYVTPTDKS
jgi:hypothetical protein